jgi:hypothetical protein
VLKSQKKKLVTNPAQNRPTCRECKARSPDRVGTVVDGSRQAEQAIWVGFPLALGIVLEAPALDFCDWLDQDSGGEKGGADVYTPGRKCSVSRIDGREGEEKGVERELLTALKAEMRIAAIEVIFSLKVARIQKICLAAAATDMSKRRD